MKQHNNIGVAVNLIVVVVNEVICCTKRIDVSRYPPVHLSFLFLSYIMFDIITNPFIIKPFIYFFDF